MANLFEIPIAPFFFLCISYSLVSYGTDGASINFNYPPLTDIQMSADAAPFRDSIQLTNSQANYVKTSSYGWACYNKSIPLWDKSSKAMANFSAYFQFKIFMFDRSNSSGDGLAFFLAASDFQASDGLTGEKLGLFKPGTDGNSSNQIVAVEFDTFKNVAYDPDDNHVGIDVNSMKSKKTVSVNDLYNNASLKNGEKWDAWVDYDGTVAQLRVFLLLNPNSTAAVFKPKNPILSYNISLREFLPPDIKVGFSASTGESIEAHMLYVWNFSGQYSWVISARRSQGRKTYILMSALACLIVICSLIFFGGMCCIMTRKKQGKGTGIGGESETKIEESDKKLDEWLGKAAQCARKFSYADLSAATKNFSDEEKIGGGGFGCVYRGTLPGTNEAVAVKRVSPTSKQGKHEYESEVIINSKLTHHNLVRFLGWCHRKDDLLLVYELLPNGSVDKYLFGKMEGDLNWDLRYSITCDIASALVYLHKDRHESVVHRDIKASNVMLDSNFKSKLGDFGLARVVKREKEGHTTALAGTIGYIAPESVTTGKATRESDMFSFGALALEIACGRRPVDWSLNDHNSRVVEWVWHLYAENRIIDAADEKLGGTFNAKEMERLLKVGLLCSHPDPNGRLRIEQVVDIL